MKKTMQYATTGLVLLTTLLLAACGGTNTHTTPVAAAVIASLPDTGITDQQCYKAGSDTLVSCSDADAIALNDQQDGMITPGTAGLVIG